MRVERVAQRRLEPAVELHDVDVLRALGEVLREHAEAAADLEHDVALVQLRRPPDDVEDVRVDEEVLAELAVGADLELAQSAQARLRRELAHQPISRAALASTAASSASYEMPRQAATKRAVWTTYAGWLRSLRTACGVR